ncbi:type III secretion system chaperone [Mesorhizobium sp. ANAO-SY3R2]|uniref:type III secretion system chaperone n=1 Tax=Mesorhizobium sp. ANAO-SY3R2 TaxID=3166644 RepID=UPI00366C125D
MQSVLPEFRSAIEALWQSLGLPAPKFTEPGHIQLRVESISLNLLDNGRGALIVEGVAGTVATEQTTRAAQIRKILQTNLGFLLDSDASVYVKSLKNQGISLLVQARFLYKSHSTAILVKKIEDVVRLTEYYSSEFKTEYATIRPAAPKFDGADAPVIFKP